MKHDFYWGLFIAALIICCLWIMIDVTTPKEEHFDRWEIEERVEKESKVRQEALKTISPLAITYPMLHKEFSTCLDWKTRDWEDCFYEKYKVQLMNRFSN